MKLSALKRHRHEEVIGRTPPDWDLQDEDGVNIYLELHVRRDTVEPWLKAQEDNKEWMHEAAARSLASITSGSANGARRYRGGRFKSVIGQNPQFNAYEEAFHERMKRPRDERRDELKSSIKAIRDHLIVDMYLCTTDESPVVLDDLYKAVDKSQTEEEENVATKELEDELAEERWLSITEDAISRRPLRQDELEVFFTANLHDDKEPHLLPDHWTYAQSAIGAVTVAQALCSVVLALAALASRGIEVERRKEVTQGKGTPSSGAAAPPPKKKRRARQKAAS